MSLLDVAHTRDEPLVLPTPAPPARRPPLPLVAAVVPLAGAVVMWLVTGSAMMLLFAALGPLIAVAALADAARGARRDRRRAAEDARAARERTASALEERHSRERETAHTLHPDIARLLSVPEQLWRAPADGLVVGRGEAASAARVVGGGDDPDAVALRARAGTVSDMPLVVPWDAGVCVTGPRAVASAVARALVLQVCLAQPPDRVGVVAAPASEGWADRLPHRGGGGPLRLALLGPGDPAPDGADIVVAAVPEGAPLPPRCRAVLSLTGPGTGRLRLGADTADIDVEGVSRPQAEAIARELAARAAETGRGFAATVSLARMLEVAGGSGQAAPVGQAAPTGPAAPVGLAVPIGLGRDGRPAFVDLVEDGPHAVLAGVTGSGKSELLTTWVTALCATRSTRDVSFLLADFKGGTAFDALAALPHVTGVITDLDGGGARRAIESLRAELRRREGVLAQASARDVGDPHVRLPRLVVVVDEFAAMLAAHPALEEVLADVAARGRALGMHLVLGTQRITGVVRDGLLANCPLRISLRVTDAGDSTAVVGTDQAARLPGGADGRGLAVVRRAGDVTPEVVRIALTSPDEFARVAAEAAGQTAPHRPWLAPLPALLPLEALAAEAREGRLPVALADEPERQLQSVVSLAVGEDRGLAVVGAARSGKTNVVDLLAAQAGVDAVRVPADPEAAWDVVSELCERGRRASLVLLDDLDALAASFPPEYAHAFLARLELLARTAGSSGTTLVVTAQRLAGAVARVADLLPHRAILRTGSRVDHVAAGGDSAQFDATAPAGRARWGERLVQIARSPELATDRSPRPSPSAAPSWRPTQQVSGVVARAPRAAQSALARALPDARVVRIDEAAVATASGSDAQVVVVDDPDGWQRHWALLGSVRSAGALVVDAACAAEYRALTGDRELPPYAQQGSGRAWALGAEGRSLRVTLPADGTC